MKHRIGSRWIAALALAGLALVGSTAQAQNIEDMLKWTSAEAVHYDVVAVYTGNATILKSDGPTRASYDAQVSDRFEMGFDWSPSTMTLVGKPTFKNFPATLPAGTPADRILSFQCPAPKVNSAYDHFEVAAAKAGMLGTNALELSFKRTYAAGSIPHANENGCVNWVESRATAENVTHAMSVPLGMFLVMPKETLPANMTVKGPDTIVVDDKNKGWHYTYTLKIVK